MAYTLKASKFIALLFFAGLINGACSLTPTFPFGEGAVTLRLTRSWFGGADAVECLVIRDQLVMSTWSAGGRGKVEYFRRSVSKDEIEVLQSVIRKSGLLQRLKDRVYLKSDILPLEYSDGVVDIYQFPALVKNAAAEESVKYYGVYDDGANCILHELNQLLPMERRFQPLPAR